MLPLIVKMKPEQTQRVFKRPNLKRCKCVWNYEEAVASCIPLVQALPKAYAEGHAEAKP
jgi:hypothetical protein